VDDVLPHEDFVARAARWLAERSTPEAGKRIVAERKRRTGGAARALASTPPGRALVLGQARKRVLAETRGHYPAPLKILEVLERASHAPIPVALAIEARAVGELLATPEHKALTALFFLSEEAKREPATPRALAVARAGVVGAGVMGGGIAQVLADAGVRVRLRDVDPAAVGRGLRAAHEVYERQIRRRRLRARDRDRRMGLISGTTDTSGFGSVDVVIEAVVEKLEVKQQVLAELERVAPERAVFLTNTSSLDLEAMGQRLVRPERLAGLHFFNPVHRMPLVEVIRSTRTSEIALDTAVALARRAGKTAVVVRNRPGFLVNRILMPYLNEALHLFQQGVPMEALDRSMTDFGMPMGPLRLLDEVGLDVAVKVSHVLGAAFGDRLEPSAVLEPMVQGGRLGKKSNLGFYRYRDRKATPDPAVYPLADRPARAVVQAGAEAWRERMVLAMVNEAARCLEQEVVASAGQLDLALILGTGFPAFRGGLLRHADVLGLPHVVERLRVLEATWGKRFAPAELLVRMAQERAAFRPEFAR
jgi:3-hydroxyacyl-CoA dehydrogenase/enoyl-CoA hydratase/3-hydroxybutyryl-CoA epimerase